MYLVNTTLTVNWVLRATIYEILRETLDIVIKPPKGKGNEQYFNAAILPENYVQPTSNTDGIVSFDFTPDQVGLWIIVLTDGTEDSNLIYYESKLLISKNDIYTKKHVKGSLL